ncbi:MAG: efflux RND transporter periplasmic adaptor subunit [Candidatus Edwardsbacteria bacterium]|nr:efflux RND transporter periplasmic adaptor subunit [Candidatus Edwardsbacteria bacterium]
MIDFKNKKSWLIAGGIAVALAALIIGNVARGSKRLSVQVAKVKKGQIVSTVSAPGNVKAETEVKLSAYVMGKITRLPVKEGDQVRKGQVLVQIDPANYAAQAKQVKASLELSQASLSQSELVYKRNKELHDKGLLSQESFEQVSTDYRLNQARLTQAEAALDQARDNLDKTTIVSPINGTVVALNVEVGEVVVTGTMNNAGSVIMTVADMAQMEVEAQVDESDVRDIKVGQPAEVTVDAIPNRTFKGEVSEVGNAAIASASSGSSSASVNYTVRIRILDKSTDLKSGMSANVEITTANKKDVMVIPIQSVVMRKLEAERKSGEKKGNRGFKGTLADEASGEGKRNKEKEQETVYVLSGGRAKITPVVTGSSDQENIEVVSGLAEDQQVIKGPFRVLRNLKHNDKVKIDKTAAGGKPERGAR